MLFIVVSCMMWLPCTTRSCQIAFTTMALLSSPSTLLLTSLSRSAVTTSAPHIKARVTITITNQESTLPTVMQSLGRGVGMTSSSRENQRCPTTTTATAWSAALATTQYSWGWWQWRILQSVYSLPPLSLLQTIAPEIWNGRRIVFYHPSPVIPVRRHARSHGVDRRTDSILGTQERD